jgi:hypothetical protein
VKDADNAAGTTGARGGAGASARAEYERRRARDEARWREAFGGLAPLVRILTGPKRTTETWGRGADGEERIGRWLDDAVGRHGVVLHDRAIRGRRTNLDHIVVVPSGVWVIDSKHYRGVLERRDTVGWFVRRPRLFVAGRDRTGLATAASRQQVLVAEALGTGPLVRAALCFTGVERALFTRPFLVQGVLVTWPKALRRTLAAPGSLGPAERRALADRLARAFPPYPG